MRPASPHAFHATLTRRSSLHCESCYECVVQVACFYRDLTQSATCFFQRRAERAHGPRIEWGVADEDRAIRGGGSGYRFQPARAARSGRRESIRPARVADIARPNMQRRLHGASRAGPYRQVGSMIRFSILQYFLRQLRAGRAKQSGSPWTVSEPWKPQPPTQDITASQQQERNDTRARELCRSRGRVDFAHNHRQ